MLQYNGDWRDLAVGNRVSLFKYLNHEWRLFDFGVESTTDKYLEKGYIVRKYQKGDTLGDVKV